MKYVMPISIFDQKLTEDKLGVEVVCFKSSPYQIKIDNNNINIEK